MPSASSFRRTAIVAACLVAGFGAAAAGASSPAPVKPFDGFWEECQRHQGELWCQSLQLEQHGEQIRGAWNWRASNTGGTNLFRGRIVGGRVEFDPEGCVIGMSNQCTARTPSKSPNYLIRCSNALHWTGDRTTTCATRVADSGRYLRIARDKADPVDFSQYDYFKTEAGDAAAGAASDKPSFDCAKAASAVEKAICRDPRLARADAALGRTYSALLKTLDAPAAKALREDQRGFIAVRDAGYAQAGRGRGDAALLTTLEYRAGTLARIRARPGAGLSGTWSNLAGEIEIQGDGKSGYRLKANAAHPLDGRWVCDASASGRGDNNGARLKVADDDEGSALQLTRVGAALQVQALDAQGRAQAMPGYCGLNGSLSGWYFPVAARAR